MLDRVVKKHKRFKSPIWWDGEGWYGLYRDPASPSLGLEEYYGWYKLPKMATPTGDLIEDDIRKRSFGYVSTSYIKEEDLVD